MDHPQPDADPALQAAAYGVQMKMQGAWGQDANILDAADALSAAGYSLSFSLLDMFFEVYARLPRSTSYAEVAGVMRLAQWWSVHDYGQVLGYCRKYNDELIEMTISHGWDFDDFKKLDQHGKITAKIINSISESPLSIPDALDLLSEGVSYAKMVSLATELGFPPATSGVIADRVRAVALQGQSKVLLDGLL